MWHVMLRASRLTLYQTPFSKANVLNLYVSEHLLSRQPLTESEMAD